MNTNTNSATTLYIHTVSPELKLGEQLISADRRGKDLTDAQRIRRITLPANHWNGVAATLNAAPSQGLQDVLIKALRAIAADRLRDTLAETPTASTVLASDYTITALLSWNADTASTRGSITFTREQVEEWYPTSALFASMASKGQQWTDYVGKRLAALAAKNHGLKKPEDATKLIALLAGDSTNALAAELIQRLSHIEKQLSTRTADALSLDDL